jgi:hypothetical protein
MGPFCILFLLHVLSPIFDSRQLEVNIEAVWGLILYKASLSGGGHHTVTKTGTLRTVPVEGHGPIP